MHLRRVFRISANKMYSGSCHSRNVLPSVDTDPSSKQGETQIQFNYILQRRTSKKLNGS